MEYARSGDNDPGSAGDGVQAIIWRADTLYLLDQRKLPAAESYLEINTVEEVVGAIRDMVTRGAPAIGITAAYGVAIAVARRYREDPARWREAIEGDFAALAAARPTATALGWALDRMRARLETLEGDPVVVALEEARVIHAEDVAQNHLMGRLGSDLIDQPCGVITHCNAGALATGGFGTALGVIRTAWIQGKITRIFADETRPWLQGSRLTAWELARDGLPVTLIADGAAASVLRRGEVGWVIVGADRIAANGDVANKIGTYSLAVAARHHGVRFMVVAPASTVDTNAASGADIPIEERPAAEIWKGTGADAAPAGVEVLNQVFDITPAALVDCLVTEKGVVEQPDTDKMAAMLAGASPEAYGSPPRAL